jgi:hypothetical protein
MQPSHPFPFPELRWQENAAAVDAFGQIDQSTASPAVALEDERMLSGEGRWALLWSYGTTAAVGRPSAHSISARP